MPHRGMQFEHAVGTPEGTEECTVSLFHPNDENDEPDRSKVGLSIETEDGPVVCVLDRERLRPFVDSGRSGVVDGLIE